MSSPEQTELTPPASPAKAVDPVFVAVLALCALALALIFGHYLR